MIARAALTAMGLAALLVSPQLARADAVVLKPALTADAAAQANLLPNPSFEEVADGQAARWNPWAAGYEIDDQVSHSGEHSARCALPVADVQRGIGYTVVLNQTRPLPIVATAWSRAEAVSGSPESNYSLYLDLEYMDGNPLWGQTASFDCGSHDWQRRTVTIVPPKPVRSVNVWGIFRNKTGTAWFDDFSLTTLEPTAEAAIFDSVPVLRQTPPPPSAEEPLLLNTDDGLQVRVDPATGALLGPQGIVSGFFWRDVAEGSDFRQPRGRVQVQGDTVTLSAEDPAMSLRLDATMTRHPDHIAIHGAVADTTGQDRAVTVYFALPLDALGWHWFDDVRRSRPIEPGTSQTNRVKVEAGAGGFASLYPLACVAGGSDACALAVPLDQPRIVGMGYDADSRELYAGFHLGLSAETRDFPSRADFSLVLYRPDPAWGFRGALERYYELFPQCFTRRNAKEGIWMPFTDVSTVDGWQDFGFQFHEGNNNVGFDDQAGIDSFVYVEPVSHWLRMPPEMPRTVEEALALLHRSAEAGDRQSQATLTSAMFSGAGEMYLHLLDTPWCDGALFYLNPLPSLLDDRPEALTQWRFCSQALWRAFEQGERGAAGWNGYQQGYDPAPGAGRQGGQAITCAADQVGTGHGASQVVVLNQQQPTDLVLRAWSRAEGVTGQPDNGYCLYADLSYQDGTPSWGHNAPFEVGTHDWQQAEVIIRPDKPVRAVTFYLLFRNNHTGRVWFDDVFLSELGADNNLLQNPGFEPASARPVVLDGIYIDSAEMGASTANFRREHWRYSALPLTFTQQGRVCQLTIFNSTEFARELALRLHDQGRMLMANSTPSRFPWLAAWCDVMGTETNWAREGNYTPQSDETLCFRRAMCYQRPYLLLLNTVYDDFPNEWVERYFKRAISYGIFPSMFSHDAATDRYWERPNLYNRDRELFKHYIPICQAIAAAGWEPVTHATCPDADIWLERFGPGDDGATYLTVFNSSTEPREATIVLDCGALGIAGDVTARDLVAEGTARVAGGKLTLSLQSEDLAVVRLR